MKATFFYLVKEENEGPRLRSAVQKLFNFLKLSIPIHQIAIDFIDNQFSRRSTNSAPWMRILRHCNCILKIAKQTSLVILTLILHRRSHSSRARFCTNCNQGRRFPTQADMSFRLHLELMLLFLLIREVFESWESLSDSHFALYSFQDFHHLTALICFGFPDLLSLSWKI